MAEICRPLREYQREDGEVEAVIEAENSWSDVIRYVVEDLGWNETLLLVQQMHSEAEARGEELDGLKTVN